MNGEWTLDNFCSGVAVDAAMSSQAGVGLLVSPTI